MVFPPVAFKTAPLDQAGAAAGLAAGTVVGAAVGIIPAIFTFGLSIPIGAAIGASAGVLTGSAVGVAGSGIARQMSASKIGSGGASLEDVKQSTNEKDADSALPKHVPDVNLPQKQADLETTVSPKASEQMWSADFAFSLGHAVDNLEHAHQFLDADAYPSVAKAVEALNAGHVSCQEGICIVRSERQKLYFMIARTDKREECASLAQKWQEQEQRNLMLGTTEELHDDNAVAEPVNASKAIETAQEIASHNVVRQALNADGIILSTDQSPTKEEH